MIAKNKKLIKAKISSSLGFSLIEIITAIGIFVTIIIIVTDTFIIYSRTQSYFSYRLNALNDVSLITERIAQDIRTGQIVYNGALSNNVQPTLKLVKVIDIKENETEEIEYSFVLPGIKRKLFNKKTSYREEQQIVDVSSMQIIAGGFFISPIYNPYPLDEIDCKINTKPPILYRCQCNNNNQCWPGTTCNGSLCDAINSQSRVTFYLVVKEVASRSPLAPFTLQTTISSRAYPR